MFTHHNLKVYQKALWFVASVESLSIHWKKSHSFVDHLTRASESIVLNIAEGARPLSASGKVVRLDYAIGSALECAACFDVAKIKSLVSASNAFEEKRLLWEITRMLIGLRKSWLPNSIQEETVSYVSNSVPDDSDVLFSHEKLDVYQVSLELMRWLVSLPVAEGVDRTYRQLEKAATSLLLNIAEGNGRYSELDHRHFLDVAASSAVKSAAYLDICERKPYFKDIDLAPGKQCLGRVAAMLSRF
jgi:four helix bundle protein